MGMLSSNGEPLIESPSFLDDTLDVRGDFLISWMLDVLLFHYLRSQLSSLFIARLLDLAFTYAFTSVMSLSALNGVQVWIDRSRKVFPLLPKGCLLAHPVGFTGVRPSALLIGSEQHPM